MLCKRCHAEVPENERFCPTCGSLQPMICPGCSAENRPGSRSCSACGKKLPAAQRPDKPVTPKRKRSPMEIAAIAAVTLGALLLLAAAVLFLTKSVSFDDSTAVREQTQTQPEAPEPVEEVPEEEPQTVPVEVVEPAQTEETPAPEEEPPAEEEPEPEEAAEPESGGQWYFADSAERLLTQDDIAGMTARDLKYARNEIYARHGRRFNSQELQSYFDSRDWYQGTIAPEDFDEGVFNDIELANIAFLKAAE